MTVPNGSGGYRSIKFVKAARKDAHAVGDKSLTPLNAPVDMDEERLKSSGEAGPSKSSAGGKGKPSSSKMLTRIEDIPMNWTSVRMVGPGYYNLGNSCFMNSVLQCLTHTPPLAEYLIKNSPPVPGIPPGKFNPVQVTLNHIRTCFQPHKRHAAVAPKSHFTGLRNLSSSFRPGRQEDAHEFLRCLLDSMQEACLKHIKPKVAPDSDIASSTFVSRIFGGRLRSQVKCTQCSYESNTYDPIMDLSLEISRGTNTLIDALKHFTKGEMLDGDNKYRCPKENKKVRAIKRMDVDKLPSVLTIHLKRFEFGSFGHKVNKTIEYPATLDMAPYLSSNNNGAQPAAPRKPILYDLYAVTVHAGHSLQSGHYYSYVKAPNGQWYRCDDEMVHVTSESHALSQKAYLLFYLSRDAVARAGALAALTPQAAVESALKQSTGAAANGAAAAGKRDPAAGTQQNPAPVPTDSDSSSSEEEDAEEEEGGESSDEEEEQGKGTRPRPLLPSVAAYRFMEPRTRTASRKVVEIMGEQPQLLQLQTPRPSRLLQRKHTLPFGGMGTVLGSRRQRRLMDIANAVHHNVYSPARTANNSDEEGPGSPRPPFLPSKANGGVHTRARTSLFAPKENGAAANGQKPPQPAPGPSSAPAPQANGRKAAPAEDPPAKAAQPGAAPNAAGGGGARDKVQTRRWLTGAYNQYGAATGGVESWEGVEAGVKRQAEALTQGTSLAQGSQKRRREYDELEQEYDMGRTKKVKNKSILEEGEGPGANGNRFDRFQKIKSGGGRGGPQNGRRANGDRERGNGNGKPFKKQHGGVKKFGRKGGPGMR